MLIDKKGKLFGKISIVDALIVILAFAVIIGLVYKFTRSSPTTPNIRKDTINLTFYSPSISNNAADEIKDGDKVTDRGTNVLFGKVIGITKGDSVIYAYDSQGKCVASAKPNYSSIRIVVEGKGKYSKAGAYLNNIEYYEGKTITTLVVNKASFPAMIYDIIKR